MSAEAAWQVLETLLWNIEMQAARRKRASGLKRYLETDLEIIERKAKQALAALRAQASPDAALIEALREAEAELRRVSRSPSTPAPGRCERIADKIATLAAARAGETT